MGINRCVTIRQWVQQIQLQKEGRDTPLKWVHLIAMATMMGSGGALVLHALPVQAQPQGGSILSQRDLLAQQVVDGLPPPPPFTPADLSNFPPPPAATGVAPTAPGTASGSPVYMVYVNGSSPLLLEQVRQVQPDALIQEYDGQPIILVGTYESQALAQQQVGALASRGIGATVTPVSDVVFEPSVPPDSGFAALPELPPADPTAAVPAPFPTEPPREFEFGPTPGTTTTYSQPVGTESQSLEDNAYYIVIPGASAELAQLQEQVIMLGARQDAVSQRERPLGPHVLVGPFSDRQAASRWNRFLRDFGLNARVYYRR